MRKLIRITTVPQSLEKLLEGQLSYMSNYFNVIAISSNEEKMQEIAKTEKIKTYTVELTRKITPIKDLKAVYQLYKILKKEKPIIVHTHTPKAGIVGMMAAYFARVPNRLHTVAGMPLLIATGKKRKLLDFVEKLTYKFATMVYPNSYSLRDIIVDLKFTNPEKLKVIAKGSSNGIDTEHFNPNLFTQENNQILKHKLGIKNTDFVFIFVGRIVGDKGINELVQAFEQLSKENQNVKLILVGSEEKELDPLKKKSLEIIENNKNIITTGFQKDVRPYFATSNCLVFPSYREGFPNVVMQAGAMKLPSIVTDINGCNEIIKEGVNGVIIPVKNIEALYEKMSLFLNKTNEELNRMGKNSRNEIILKYKRNVVWEALLNEYKLLEKIRVKKNV